MAKVTTVDLEPEDEAFINELIASGEYASVDEIMRDALRLMEEDKRAEAALREQEGLHGGGESAQPGLPECSGRGQDPSDRDE